MWVKLEIEFFFYEWNILVSFGAKLDSIFLVNALNVCQGFYSFVD